MNKKTCLHEDSMDHGSGINVGRVLAISVKLCDEDQADRSLILADRITDDPSRCPSTRPPILLRLQFWFKFCSFKHQAKTNRRNVSFARLPVQATALLANSLQVSSLRKPSNLSVCDAR